MWKGSARDPRALWYFLDRTHEPSFPHLQESRGARARPPSRGVGLRVQDGWQRATVAERVVAGCVQEPDPAAIDAAGDNVAESGRGSRRRHARQDRQAVAPRHLDRRSDRHAREDLRPPRRRPADHHDHGVARRAGELPDLLFGRKLFGGRPFALLERIRRRVRRRRLHRYPKGRPLAGNLDGPRERTDGIGKRSGSNRARKRGRDVQRRREGRPLRVSPAGTPRSLR